MSKIPIAILLLLGCCNAAFGQQSNKMPEDASVVVESWKLGTTTMKNSSVQVTLDSKVQEYELDLQSVDRSKGYRLQFSKIHVQTVRRRSIQCWLATLREIEKVEPFGGIVLGHNVLKSEGPEPGHYIPQDSFAGYFCPIEDPKRVLDGPFYSIFTERRFIIEGFTLGMAVSNYKYNESEIRMEDMKLNLMVNSH